MKFTIKKELNQVVFNDQYFSYHLYINDVPVALSLTIDGAMSLLDKYKEMLKNDPIGIVYEEVLEQGKEL